VRPIFYVHKTPPTPAGFCAFLENFMLALLTTARTLNTSDAVDPPPAVLPLRTVVTQNRVPSGREGRTGKNRQCFRYPYVIASDCSELVVSHQGWTMENTGESNLPNNYSILELSLEANGIVVPVTYGGSRTQAITAGDVDIQSDAILPSDFGLSQFSYADIIWVKGIASVASTGQSLPYSTAKVNEYSGSQAGWWDSTANSVSSTDVTGVYIITGGSFDSRATGMRPIIFGRPLTDIPSFVTIGDSIADASNDSASMSGTLKIHGVAFIQRSMRSTSDTDYLPSLNMGRSATGSTSVSAGTRVKQYYKYARFGIDEYGTNNMPSTGSSLTPLQSSCTTNWTDMRNAGVEKIIRTKFLPRCTSTDNFTTVANQTYMSAWAPGESSDLMNQWFATELSAGHIDYLISMDGCRDASLPFKWRTASPETTANYTAADSTHPSSQGHEFLAEELRPILRSL